MEFKEYMKRSFLEYIEHLNEYNLDEPEYFYMIESYITRLAAQEAYSQAKEVMNYADYLINKLHEYVDIQKEDKGIEMKVGESLTIKVEPKEEINCYRLEEYEDLIDGVKSGEYTLKNALLCARYFSKRYEFDFEAYTLFRVSGATEKEAISLVKDSDKSSKIKALYAEQLKVGDETKIKSLF
ncbi:hypothetical protein E9863_10780 [Salmonella enterica]|uniref:hypothetical protein n=1 Tax=Salmonella enterica TaxID=28901 RepID=UPI0009B0C5E4|nr:hypothetical protein [Salmonella enterica]EAV6171730.1 hypothetical protein [Salmonella enterica subsp. enterica serovar Havana]